ncbi:hypothetical protein C5E11_04000 [Clavibacter michiganensis]|nr:ParB N-terminal domain-containing protein [Clavibacter michiganensis]PPF64561.1 hypothetical protein C5E11_04000 [Clavibacter michiganensis]
MTTPNPTIEQLDPRTLIVDINVRKEPNLTADFLKSVKENGVLQPPVIYRDAAGAPTVKMGHRRTLAAVEAGIDLIWVIVAATPDEAGRIVEQLVENHHRSGLRAEEEVEAYEQLALIGLPAIDIAKRTGTKMSHVGDAIKASKSPAAMKAITTYQTTVDDALIYAEFDGDADAIARLDTTMNDNPRRLPHTAEMIRNDRAREAARQVVIEEILAAGLTLADPEPSHGETSIIRVNELYTDPKQRNHLSLEVAREEAGEDLRAFPRFEQGTYNWDTGTREPGSWIIDYAVVNYEAHGWKPYDYGTAGKGPLTDEEKAQRALQKINGKAWVAATTLRLEWITKLLQRRNLPNEWPALAALCYTTLPSDYGTQTNNLAHQLLAIEKPGSYSASALPEAVTSNPLRAPHVMVAIAAAWMESNLDEKKGWDSTREYLPFYLQQISAWGYTLSELEQNIVDKLPTDEAGA